MADIADKTVYRIDRIPWIDPNTGKQGTNWGVCLRKKVTSHAPGSIENPYEILGTIHDCEAWLRLNAKGFFNP